MLVPDALKTNAYRVLGLSANATSSEVHRAADGLKRAAALGVSGSVEGDFLVLGRVAQTEADIRAAVSRLSSPSQRLYDRLFWFHTQPARNALFSPLASDPVLSSFAEHAEVHDAALGALFRTFEAPLDDAGFAAWTRTLRSWHGVVSNDAYWTLFWGTEERGRFEPKAVASELESLRADAFGSAAGVLVSAAKTALVQGDNAALAGVLRVLLELVGTSPWVEKAHSELSRLALERVRKLCQKVREESGSRIDRSNSAALANKKVCEAALARYRNEVQPALHDATQFLPAGEEKENADSLREAAAMCLFGIAVDYTWADDFIKSEELHEEALKLATGTLSEIKIKSELTNVGDGARRQRFFGRLKPISAAPSLSTFNGFGFKLYGSSDYDKETDSYATTYYFVGLFFPLFPIRRYRVRNSGGRQFSFLGALPLRNGDRWHQGIAAAAIVLMVLLNSSGNSTSSHAEPDSSVQSDSVTSPDPFGEILKASPARTGSDYSASSQLPTLKGEIDNNRSRMAVLESQLQLASDELDRLKARIESISDELEPLKAQHDAQLPIDIDEFNTKVDDYNALVSRHRAKLSAYRSDIDRYNQLVQNDKTLVAQYNALLR